MCKEYRVDGFYSGNHSKKYFETREEAERYGKQQTVRGEIVFLLQRTRSTNVYDVISILQ